VAEGVGFEPTDRLLDRLISSQVPSTNSATLPSANQGSQDRRTLAPRKVNSSRTWFEGSRTGTVSIIDTASNQVLPTSINIGPAVYPQVVTFAPDGLFAYVGNYSSTAFRLYRPQKIRPLARF
jgi:DNA-binding beta-propeller fold protein YncE